MPRKSCDTTNEFRLTLGDFERKKVQEINTQQTNAALIKQAPVILIAGGVGVAAYALWRWVGLGSIIDRVTDGFDNFVQTNKDAWMLATTGDITQTQTGSKVFESIYNALEDMESKYQEKVAELNLIISNPNTSPNVKAQAELDLQSANRAYAKQHKKFMDALERLAGR